MSEKLLGQLVELAGGTGWEIVPDYTIPWKHFVTIYNVTQAQADIIGDILLATIAAPFSLEVRVRIRAPVVAVSGNHIIGEQQP